MPELKSYKCNGEFGEILMSDVGRDLTSVVNETLHAFNVNRGRNSLEVGLSTI